MAPSEAWDACTQLWWTLLEAEKDLTKATIKCEEIQRERERGRHVRAKRTEEAEDDLYTASRDPRILRRIGYPDSVRKLINCLGVLHLQRQLGLEASKVDVVAAKAALRQRCGQVLEQMTTLGLELGYLGLPKEIWHKVVRASLPCSEHD